MFETKCFSCANSPTASRAVAFSEERYLRQKETALTLEGRRAGLTYPGVAMPTTLPARQVAEQRQRVGVYVDGFNLYNGLKLSYGHRHLWLDLEKMATNLLKPGQELAEVMYFTARLRDDPGRRKRQAEYLWALAESCVRLVVIEGRFKIRKRRCRECSTRWVSYEEKQTDVALAARMVTDAVRSAYDVMLLVSADGDLCPAVDAVRLLHPAAKVVACFPPRRLSDDLRRVVDASFTIGEDKFRASQLPDTVVTRNGVALTRPAKWS